ncbi:5787_t:CDS:1, partial [Racocetra persica]
TAPWFHKISSEMLNDIKFYMHSTEGIGAKIQYNFLKTKYPDKHIDKKDLYNAIQPFCVLSCEKVKTDTVETLQKLIVLKADDPE